MDREIEVYGPGGQPLNITSPESQEDLITDDEDDILNDDVNDDDVPDPTDRPSRPQPRTSAADPESIREESIEEYITRMGGDPKDPKHREMAKSYKHLERMHSRKVAALQSELNLVRSGQLPNDKPGTPTATPGQPPLPETPALPASPVSPTVQPAEDPLVTSWKDPDPSTIFDPSQHEVDPETGWVVGEGGLVQPHDIFGVPYTPDSRWEVVLRQLESEVDAEGKPKYTPAQCLFRVQKMQEAESERLYEARNEVYVKAQTVQTKAMVPAVTEIENRLSQRYPEVVAKGLAQWFGEAGRKAAQDAVTAGKVPPEVFLRKDFYARCANAAFQQALLNEQIDDYAEKVLQSHRKRNGAPRREVPPTPSANSPVVERRGLADREVATANKNGKEPDYMAKDFNFDE